MGLATGGARLVRRFQLGSIRSSDIFLCYVIFTVPYANISIAPDREEKLVVSRICLGMSHFILDLAPPCQPPSRLGRVSLGVTLEILGYKSCEKPPTFLHPLGPSYIATTTILTLSLHYTLL